MTPFTKRNLLIPFSTLLLVGLLYGLTRFVPALKSSVQHLEFIVLALMIMLSIVVMLFWVSVGVLGGLVSLLCALIFLYKPLTNLNPYYYSILILAFFLSSYIGHQIAKKTVVSSQKHKVTMEKVNEDINLVNNHLKNRKAEISAMSEKLKSLLKIKDTADKLSLTLSTDEVIGVVGESVREIFKDNDRVSIYLFDQDDSDPNLRYSFKPDSRKPIALKKGGIFERWVIKNMKSLLVKDAHNDFRFSIEDEEIGDDFVSLISKPLISESNLLGILRVDNTAEGKFTQHELRMLDIIGELVSVALDNAKLYRQTEELAIKDSLTGLVVHRYFMERLEEEVKRAHLSGSSFALLMLDIDSFKDFNDQHGHIAGDIVLKKIAKILIKKASAGDIVCRYGGEEFVFVSLNSTRKEAMQLAEEIRTEIEASPVTVRREKRFVTVSIGVAMFPQDARLRDDIIWEADKFMYKAKGKGKNTICSK